MKKDVARIVHEYLIRVLKEPDETDIRAASALKDLYSCRVCAGHIAQVYVKGIVFPRSDRIFGLDDHLEADELEAVEERIFDTSLRKRVPAPETGAERIRTEDIRDIADPLVVDVREAVYDGYPVEDLISGTAEIVSIPLIKIYRNPHIVCDDKLRNIVFVCDRGIKASMAAECTVKAGFMRVYYTGLDDPEEHAEKQ